MGVSFFRDANWVEPVLGEVDYTNTREVTSRFLLDQGHYVLVPSTFDPDIQAQYLIRLYAWTSEFYCRWVKRGRTYRAFVCVCVLFFLK